MFPALQRHGRQEISRRGASCRSVEIEASHERYVDNPAAQSVLGDGQFLGVQRPQCVVLVAPPDRDPHDLHSSPPGFVEQACRISTAEQFAEEDENITFAKDLVFGNAI
ncbi:hypothetical protein D9M72_615490 [compost metagenome]